MGRSKAMAPKRRRIEDETKEQEAIQALLSIPPEQVEAAAADATRNDIQDWPKVAFVEEDRDAPLPDFVSGLGISHTLPKHHFEALQLLHETIKQSTKGTWSPWSGKIEDPRKRAFGFLPDTLGYQEQARELLDVSAPWKRKTSTTEEAAEKQTDGIDDDDVNDERQRNNKAMVVLKEIPTGVKDAIEYICQHFRPSVPDTEQGSSIKPYLTYENLIAAQPNLHSGRHLLPAHVDHPLKDGFGILIVTVAIHKSGTIFIRDHTNTKGITMLVKEGQTYMICDEVRNSCVHGIIADPDDSDRESLNLRFGLHDYNGVSTKVKTPTGHADEVAASNITTDDANVPSQKVNTNAKHRGLATIPARGVLKFWEEDLKY